LSPYYNPSAAIG